MPASRGHERHCPLCKSMISEFRVHFDTQMKMCENTKCPYPFNQPVIDDFIGPVPQKIRKPKLKKKQAASATRGVAIAPAPLQMHSMQSANENRQGVLSSLSVSDVQKDQNQLLNSSSSSVTYSQPPLFELPTWVETTENQPGLHTSQNTPQLMTDSSTVSSESSSYTLEDIDNLLFNDQDNEALPDLPDLYNMDRSPFDLLSAMNLTIDSQNSTADKCIPFGPDHHVDRDLNAFPGLC